MASFFFFSSANRMGSLVSAKTDPSNPAATSVTTKRVATILRKVDSFLAMFHLLSKTFRFHKFIDQWSETVEDQNGKLYPFGIGPKDSDQYR